MSILFMGGEMDAFVANSSSVSETAATAWDNFNAGFCRCSIQVFGPSQYIEGALASGHADVWMHFEMSGKQYALVNHKRWVWLDASGNERVRIMLDETTDILTLEYWNGSAWASAGTTTCTVIGSRQTIDIHAIVNSGSGSLKLYIAGTQLISSGSIDLSGIASLKNFRFIGAHGTLDDYSYISQVIVADEPTIGMRLLTRYPSGVGADTGWTGSYTNIDELAYDDADFILSGTANQVSTFSQTGPSLTGYNVRAVGVCARARCGVGGPQHLELALRSAGTTYFGASQALDVGYVPYQEIWETDPATSAAWVNTAVGSLQPGVKSIA